MARSLSTARAAVYAVVTAAQAIMVGYGLVGDGGLWLPVTSAALAALAGGLAVANTPVTSAWAGSVNGAADPNAPVVQ